MKKILVILFFIPLLLLSEMDFDKVNSVLISIEPLSLEPSAELKFYSSTDIHNIDTNLMISSFEDADIILFPKRNDHDKMMIVNSFQKLKVNTNNIGAIYLKKGRTQIVFVKERLKNNGLLLPKIFNNHIISECQLNPVCLLLNY